MIGKLAYLTATFPPLTETFVRREIESLRRRGIDVEVFSLRRSSDLIKNTERWRLSQQATFINPDYLGLGLILLIYWLFKNPGGFFHCLGLIWKQIQSQPVRVVTSLFGHLLGSAVIAYYVPKQSIRHLHAHFSTASTMALFCHYLCGVSYSFTAHASDDIYVNPISLTEKMSNAAMVIAISQYNRAYLNLLTEHQFSEKMCVINNGVEIPGSFTYKADQKSCYELLSIGGLKYFKGFSTLIESAAILRDRGYRIRLKIIGEGPERALLESLIGKLQLGSTVELLGSQEYKQAQEQLHKTDIFILASEIYQSGMRDGWPTVLTEAMAQGIPCVSTYISGIPELIEDGISGLLVPERHAEQLAQAIARLIDHPDFRLKIAQNGYLRVLEQFNIEKTNQELYAAFKPFLDQS